MASLAARGLLSGRTGTWQGLAGSLRFPGEAFCRFAGETPDAERIVLFSRGEGRGTWVGAVPLESFVWLLVGLVIGLAGVYVLARLRAQTARALAEQIVVNAHREAETTRRHAELAAKEESLKRREELDAEIDAKRISLHEQERRLEKRLGPARPEARIADEPGNRDGRAAARDLGRARPRGRTASRDEAEARGPDRGARADLTALAR